MNKPPAFQFYVKDWLGSPTRRKMSRADKGLFWDLAAIAWDSEEPGTITMPEEDFCKLLGILPKVFRKFHEKFPKTFSKVDGKLVQPKLAAQWTRYKEISDIRSAAANLWHANASQVLCPAVAVSSAVSSAVTPKTLKEREEKTKYVPAALMVPTDLWFTFVEMRQKIRKPLTNRAADLIVAKLRSLGDQGQDPVEILSQSIMNCWAGVFP